MTAATDTATASIDNDTEAVTKVFEGFGISDPSVLNQSVQLLKSMNLSFSM